MANQKILVVDAKKCIACAACVSICPQSFTLDMSDINATTVANNPSPDTDADIHLAIETCPTAAIKYK